MNGSVTFWGKKQNKTQALQFCQTKCEQPGTPRETSHSSKYGPRYSPPQRGRSSLSTKPGLLRLLWVAWVVAVSPTVLKIFLSMREKRKMREDEGDKGQKRKENNILY